MRRTAVRLPGRLPDRRMATPKLMMTQKMPLDTNAVSLPKSLLS